ncbi:MAG: hypothetical protein JXR70_19510 [Spirochaetales bacterium]|nr:hypothetical protein [Spirochaetales bacterium]
MKITLKTVSLIGIYVYTLGFVIAAFVMLIFRKNDLAFYLNQNLNTVQLLLTAFFFCLVCGLAIQLAFGNLE